MTVCVVMPEDMQRKVVMKDLPCNSFVYARLDRMPRQSMCNFYQKPATTGNAEFSDYELLFRGFVSARMEIPSPPTEMAYYRVFQIGIG